MENAFKKRIQIRKDPENPDDKLIQEEIEQER